MTIKHNPQTTTARPSLPTHGAANPGNDPSVTTPGSFALAPDVGGPLMFASPNTPGMPAASEKSAWDFLPDGWSVEDGGPALGTPTRSVGEHHAERGG
ncbi:MAG: hypothetical protein ACK5TP_10795, partial [bacterium]